MGYKNLLHTLLYSFFNNDHDSVSFLDFFKDVIYLFEKEIMNEGVGKREREKPTHC